jgi:hypothetical protein
VSNKATLVPNGTTLVLDRANFVSIWKI